MANPSRVVRAVGVVGVFGVVVSGVSLWILEQAGSVLLGE